MNAEERKVILAYRQDHFKRQECRNIGDKVSCSAVVGGVALSVDERCPMCVAADLVLAQDENEYWSDM